MKTFTISIFILSLLFSFTLEQINTEEKIHNKLHKTAHEWEAIKILKESIYNNLHYDNMETLKLLFQKNWLEAARLLLDFSMTNTIPSHHLEEMIVKYSDRLIEIKSFLKEKKKNIVRISPIFEWSQDNELIKIRLKFARNLESPGEKDILNFKVDCERTSLKVQGYKVHEDYVAYYFRKIHLYDFIRTHSCTAYKETDGSYIIKFEKNQPTLYWNYLDQPTGDHANMYTWFDVFTAYDSKAKYTDFREMAQNNLLMYDIDEYVKEKKGEQKVRTAKIANIITYLNTKDYENKNFCNSPVNESFCLLGDIHNWNYWLY